MLSLSLVVLLTHLAFPSSSTSDQFNFPEQVNLAYAPAPAKNPLKGLVPYAGPDRGFFPHSLEFQYFAVSQVVRGPGVYDWIDFDRFLNAVADRGHQAIFRFHVEYPGVLDAIPKYLLDQGLTVHRWVKDPEGPAGSQPILTPDYNDPRLIAMLVSFVEELGKRYDGDPRIGFITAGLLGTWGEWHCYPHGEWFANEANQRAILDSFDEAFSVTPILLRYPAGPNRDGYVANHDRDMGYHDDSFAWATLDTGRDSDDWYFLALLKAAGPNALNRWKSQPIGGEVRPELWGKIFDQDPGIAQAQDFSECVEATHVSWLMETSLFQNRASPDRYQRAIRQVRRMGYEFYVRSTSIGLAENQQIQVTSQITNRGVAPFYYDWSIEYAWLNSENQLVKRSPSSNKLIDLLPGQERTWKHELSYEDLEEGSYQIVVRTVHPLANGTPLRFANQTQDANREGWLTLGSFEIH